MRRVLLISIYVDQDLSGRDIAEDELGTTLVREVQQHLERQGHRVPEPRCYIMSDAESDQ